jgi:hypothetical protein
MDAVVDGTPVTFRVGALADPVEGLLEAETPVAALVVAPLSLLLLPPPEQALIIAIINIATVERTRFALL